MTALFFANELFDEADTEQWGDRVGTRAKVAAILAVAEEQRIANLIAYAALPGVGTHERARARAAIQQHLNLSGATRE